MDMTAEESEVCVMSSPICIIGDSITGGVVYLSDSARYTHWKDSFVNLLGSSLDSELKNHSKFGCTSGAALKRLERYAKDISACPTTLVMLGGNDSDFNWPAVAAEPEAPHDCNTPMEKFAEYYNRVLDGIIALGSKPVVINLIPVYGKRYFDWFSRKLDPKALMRFWARRRASSTGTRCITSPSCASPRAAACRCWTCAVRSCSSAISRASSARTASTPAPKATGRCLNTSSPRQSPC